MNSEIKTKRIIYIDTDTTFTAYLLAGFILKNECELETKYSPQNPIIVIQQLGGKVIVMMTTGIS